MDFFLVRVAKNVLEEREQTKKIKGMAVISEWLRFWSSYKNIWSLEEYLSNIYSCFLKSEFKCIQYQPSKKGESSLLKCK